MIKPAHIEWSEGTPISTEFDDVYFSKASGIDETRYVFLQQNQLAERWQQLNAESFTIMETGFGTGLNFLCAVDLWLKSQPQFENPNAQLHFITVEKFPLTPESLKQALAHWPEFETISNELITKYPAISEGWHAIKFPTMSVTLHLYFGDIHDWLPQVTAQVDAWFLDGFAPSKNPQMWSQHLFRNMMRLTKVNGTAATFTSAGLVKRGLKGAGFAVKKVKGFGKKREMLTAALALETGPKVPEWHWDKPWLTPSTKKINTNSNKKSALVIGGGISGCSSAYALAQRGWHVTLLEANDSLASGGSGNPQGVLYAKLSADMNLHSQFYLQGYQYSLQQLNETLDAGKDWDHCGVLHLAFSEKEQKRQQQFSERFDLGGLVEQIDSKKASELAGIDISQSGLYFPHGGWVYPKAWCQKITEHPNIQIQFNETVISLCQHTVQKTGQEKGLWQARTQSGNVYDDFENVIVCSASQAKNLEQLSFLPTKAIAGQVTQLETKSETLKTVLCGSSYVAPSLNGKTVFGATYRLGSDDDSVLSEDNESNIKNLANDFPSTMPLVDTQSQPEGRASIRCTSPDYTPIAGPVCIKESFENDFANLAKNKDWQFNHPADFYSGLYVNVGHGSRGLSSAPLCAELIACQIQKEPWPMERKLANMLSPNRFLVKGVVQTGKAKV